jgi:multiple sugar transport system substrate-binding protein
MINNKWQSITYPPISILPGGRKMRKIKQIQNYLYIGVVAVFLLWSSMAGCALNERERSDSRTGEKSITAKTGEPEQKKVRFIYRKSEIDFEKIVNVYNGGGNSSFQVEAVSIAADKYDETLNALFTSGEGPDVFEIGRKWINGYITKGWVYNIKNSFSDTTLKKYPDWIYQFIPDPYTTDQLYTLPAGQLTIRLLYNRDLFRMAGLDPELPPKTLEELKYAALKITNAAKGYKKYGFALNAGDGAECFEQYLEYANTYSGVYYYDFKQRTYNLNVYDPWFRAIGDMKSEESIFPGETVLKSDKALSQFAEGNIGMMYADFSAIKTLQQLRVQSGKACDWGVAMPPALDADGMGKGKVSIIPTAFFCVNSKSQSMEGAVRFWHSLYAMENIRDMYKQGYIIPVMDGVITNREYRPELENFEKFLPGENDAVYPAAARNVDDWSRFDSYLEAIHGIKPVREVLKSESDNLNFLLDNQQGLNHELDTKFDWRSPLKRQ